jgi:serine/threonine protein kinase
MLGQTISHYRIEAELGRGGMGVVYRAHDRRLRRDVALKLLPPEFAAQEPHRERILAEARAAAALNHPGITTIYEVGEAGGHAFIVMELLTGKTLRALAAEGKLDPRAAARIGAQITEALAAAHERGIVHGDIKPENVVVLPEGRIKLLDFGIARHLAALTWHTEKWRHLRPRRRTQCGAKSPLRHSPPCAPAPQDARQHHLSKQTIDAGLIAGPGGLQPGQYVLVEPEGHRFLGRAIEPPHHGRAPIHQLRNIRSIDFSLLQSQESGQLFGSLLKNCFCPSSRAKRGICFLRNAKKKADSSSR